MMSVTESATSGPSEPWVAVVLAIISAVVSIVGGFFAYRAATHSKQTNDAVNHRHRYGIDEAGEPTTPKLFDLVLDSHAIATKTAERVEALDSWKDRWDGLPEELSDSHGLEAKLSAIDGTIVATRQSLGERIERLDHTNTQQHEAIVAMVEAQNATMTQRDDTAASAIAALSDRVVEHIVPRIDSLATELEHHVQWEEHVKYPEVMGQPPAQPESKEQE